MNERSRSTSAAEPTNYVPCSKINISKREGEVTTLVIEIMN